MVLQHLLRFSDGEVDDVDPSAGPLLEHVESLMSRLSPGSRVHACPPPDPAIAIAAAPEESGRFFRFQLRRDAEHGFGLVVRTVQYQFQDTRPLLPLVIDDGATPQEGDEDVVHDGRHSSEPAQAASRGVARVDAAASSFLVVVEMPPVRSLAHFMMICHE